MTPIDGPAVRVVRLTARPESVDEIQRALDAMWVDHGEIPDAIRGDVAVAASEVGTNIIKYAAPGREVTIEMRLQVSSNRVNINFTDDGRPAPVDLTTVHMPDVMAESGRGLALAQALLSELSYHRDDCGNHWTLVSETFG